MENRIKTTQIKQVKLTILKKQNWTCAICGYGLKTKWKTDSRFIHLDHDHETGHIRGVLCRICNIIEGKAWNSYCRQTKKDKRSVKKYLKIIKGLEFYYDNHRTDLIHPTHKTLEEKKELQKKRRLRKAKQKRLKRK